MLLTVNPADWNSERRELTVNDCSYPYFIYFPRNIWMWINSINCLTIGIPGMSPRVWWYVNVVNETTGTMATIIPPFLSTRYDSVNACFVSLTYSSDIHEYIKLIVLFLIGN